MLWTAQVCQLCTVRLHEECYSIDIGIGGDHKFVLQLQYHSKCAARGALSICPLQRFC